MKKVKYRALIYVAFISISLLISGCSSTNYAPVVSGVFQKQTPKGRYRVKRYDTVYSIAWAFGLDYRQLALINRIKPPYRISEGQMLIVAKHRVSLGAKALSLIKIAEEKYLTMRKRPNVSRYFVKNMAPVETIKYGPVREWYWPSYGRIIQTYAPGKGNKGINIVSNIGSPVYAAAAGEVVYSGTGLRSYGNLIIIKHNDEYLSAYAYNRSVLVHEGQDVSGGQKIAEMGSSGAERVMLHFEVRRAGKPINPLLCLPRR